MSGYVAVSERDHILFGDVFSAGWMHDVFLREDAIALGPFTRGGGVTCYAPVDPAKRRQSQELILAHGRPAQAVILSDDCEIESVLVRRGRGRVLFAAVGPWPEDGAAAEDLMRTTAFYRHPLRPDGAYAGGVVDLRRLFMVDARAISASDRDVCLGEGLRARLEQRWAAFAGRRGPLAHLSGAQKLARVIEAAGDSDRLESLNEGTAAVDPATVEASRATAVALSHAWELEGALVNGADLAHEEVSDGSELVSDMASRLRELAELAGTAAALLDGLKAA